MDTIEGTEPVGGEGATSSQDTSAYDTQTAETPDAVSAPEGAEAEQTEVLLAGKYKSAEELEKAYLAAQNKISEQGQKARLADLIQEKYGMTPEQFEASIEAEENARLEQEYATNPGGAALREVNNLKAELALQKEERELDSFLSKSPEYTAHRDKILKLGLNLERGKSFEDIAREYFGEAIATGQQAAYKKIEAKKMGQQTSVTSTPKKQISEADLRSLSSAELEALLPHADTSGRL